MRKNILLILLMLLFGQDEVAISQSLYDSPIPPTSTSSVFRQFSGYTPSLATGTVNVPIPLYDLKVNSFSLPFSLQYYTSGIKVMAPTFPLGYGWSLNPGLRITRTIRGRADGFSLFPMDIKSQTQVDMMGEDERFYYLRSMMKKTTDQSNIDYLINADSQYDIFTIHLPSGNYTFIIKDGKAYTFGNMLKIDIIKDTYCTCGFEVTDEYGVKYYFGKESQSGISDYTEISTDSNYEYTAWMLRKIKLPDDSLSEINFTWFKNMASGSGGNSGAPYNSSISIFLRDNLGSDDAVTSFQEGMAYQEPGINPNNRYGYSLQLKQIDFPMGTIKLEYYMDMALTSFKVQDSSNEIIKQIDFTYVDGPISSHSLLSSVNFSDEGKYKFKYNPERFGHIHGQDYWGYNNGKTQSILSPKTKIDWAFYGWIDLSTGGDRSIDRDKMQANMLIRVDYPTGGYTEFEYEPHRFEEPTPKYNKYYGKLTEGRGLRVSKVITKTDAGSVPIIKTYLYGKSTGNGFNINGLGNVTTSMSTLDSFWELNMYETLIEIQTMSIPRKAAVYYRLMNINSSSHFDRIFSMAPPIYYDYITELVSSSNNETKLKTEYTYSQTQYTIADNLSAESGHYVVLSEGNLFSKGPLLTGKKTYKTNNNGSYTLVEGSTYQYTEHFDNTIFELYVCRNKTNAYDGPDYSTPLGANDHKYSIITQYGYVGGPYYNYIETRIQPLYNELVGETKTLYTDNGEVTAQTMYQHQDNTLLLQKEVTISEGSTVKEDYKYRSYDGRMYAYPISAKTTRNRIFEEKKTNYHSNKLSLPESVFFSTGKDDYSEFSNDLRLVYHNYNSYGKPVYLTQDDVTKIVYLWSYKGQYPVAEIRNATYDQIKAVIPEATLNNIADAALPSTQQVDQINNLRKNPSLKDAMISTYTYKPMVGITSVTDPQGITVYYDYDSFGKLKYVRDADKKAMNWYQYNFYDGSGWEEEDKVYQPIRLKFNYYDDAYSLPWNNQYFKTFRAIKAGGSDSYQYIWTIRNTNDEILVTYNSGTNPEYKVDLSRWASGQMTLTCTVEDLITHENRSIHQSLNVYMTPLIFEDIRWLNKSSGTVVTANLISGSRKTIRFIHESQINVAYIFRDSYNGTRTFNFNSGTGSRDVVIEAGVTTVELYLENSNPGVFNQVKFKIFGSDYPLSHIGNPYKWISDYLIYPNPY